MLTSKWGGKKVRINVRNKFIDLDKRVWRENKDNSLIECSRTKFDKRKIRYYRKRKLVILNSNLKFKYNLEIVIRRNLNIENENSRLWANIK